MKKINEQVYFAKAIYDEREIKAVVDCLQNRWLGSGKITDKFENLYIAFESEIDQLNPDELFELCQYLHKEDFICKKCEYVYTYDEYLANEADKYSKLEWTVIYDKNKSEK